MKLHGSSSIWDGRKFQSIICCMLSQTARYLLSKFIRVAREAYFLAAARISIEMGKDWLRLVFPTLSVATTCPVY